MVDTDAVDGGRSPGLARRIGFWVYLGLVSTAFAEVLFPNTPVALLVVIAPVYLLHAVVLAGVVFRAGRVTYPALYLAGVLFGLWEAYVTKVVWAPVGDPIPFQVAGVYWFEALSLVLFWHPVVAFVLPVVVVEAVATDSGRAPGPPLAGHRYAPHLAVAAGAYLALFQGTLGVAPAWVLLANVVTLAVLLGGLAVWRATGSHGYAMAALLPRGRELWTLGAALAGLYLVLGATFRPGALPRRPLPHLIVLAAYAVVGGALLATLRRGPDADATTAVAFTWPRVLAATAAFVLASFGSGLLLAPLGSYVFLSYFVVGLAVGATSLAAVGLGRRR